MPDSSTWSYAYDGSGRLTQVTDPNSHTTSIAYGFHNRLTNVTVGGTVVATYVYDALGRRIGSDDNGTQTWTVYNGANPYADFNGSGTLLERYLYGPAVADLAHTRARGGTSAWYLTDRLGSVEMLSVFPPAA